MKTLLRYVKYALIFLAGTLTTWEALAQTWNFSGPVSYVTTAAGYRAMGVILVDDQGVPMAAFSDGKLRALVEVENGSTKTGRNNAVVEGCVEHDTSVAACQPVQTGGWASAAVPADVSADGDAARAWYTLNGEQHVVSTFGASSTPTSTADTATSTSVLAANTQRVYAECENRSTVSVNLGFGITPTTGAAGSYNVRLAPGAIWSSSGMPTPLTVINGIWDSDASGTSLCWEGTAN